MTGLGINIRAGATASESTVTATGSLVNIIANSERASFGIGSDADLKRAIGKYFGKEPNDAFLKSPTPWDDLYKRYGWPQVQRVLKPVKVQILDVKSKPTILSFNNLKNESDKPATYTTKISENVTDTVGIEWNNSSKVSVEQSISYGVNIADVFSIGGETKFGFEHAWGKSETVSKQVSAGMETGVTVELNPGESAIVELSASRGTMRIRITYEAHLTGCTAVNYNPKYKGHHFWGLNIGSVLGGSNKVEVVEDIEVGYYSNATARVRNVKTNEEMISFMATHPNESPSEEYSDDSPSAHYQGEPPSHESQNQE